MADNKLNIEIHKLTPSALVELFQLDVPENGDNAATTVYFHTGANSILGITSSEGYTGSLVWNGQVYAYVPIEITGFEITSKGTLPTPTIKVGNITGAVSALCLSYNDMIGAKLTRRRAFTRFLDAVNFPNNYNPDANPALGLREEVFYIEQKSNENPLYVEFKCSSALDVDGVKLPRRKIQCTTCPWVYRGADCQFTKGYNDDDGEMDFYVREDGSSYIWSATKNYRICTGFESGEWFHPINWIQWDQDASGDWHLYRARMNIDANPSNQPPHLDPVRWKRDWCFHSLEDCKYHWGAWNNLTFGGFPGASTSSLS